MTRQIALRSFGFSFFTIGVRQGGGDAFNPAPSVSRRPRLKGDFVEGSITTSEAGKTAGRLNSSGRRSAWS